MYFCSVGLPYFPLIPSLTRSSFCYSISMGNPCRIQTMAHPWASIPLRQWCISPCFWFPPISDKFLRLREQFSHFYLFPTNILIFIRQNFWWPSFSHRLQILNFSLFSLFPYFAKIIIPPTFTNFPIFGKFTCFYILSYFMCISFPPLLWPWCIYPSHNARTGRPWTSLAWSWPNNNRPTFLPWFHITFC